jgi:SynChlorMet cassette radical SAM/SPASM protein ScmF
MPCDPQEAPGQPARELDLPQGVPPLTTYYVYLTAGCNLACRHCWLSPAFQPHGGTGGHLDTRLFELALDEGLRLGLSQVKLTGGEPLLHPDFTRMVDLLQERGLGLTVETNGTLLTPALARHLREKSTLRHISVSVDGASPETHDPFRGVEGSFERAVQGIRCLVEAGYRPQVIMSLHAGNVGEIEALVQMAEALGAGSVKFNLIQPAGRGERMAERGQALDIRRLIELGRWVEGDLQKRSSIPLHYSWPMAFHGLRQLMDAGTCGIFGMLGILPTGHLAMCGIGVQVPELCYGLLGQDRVADVWQHNTVLIEIRSSLPADLEGICGECILRGQCLGHCIAENCHLAGRLTAPYWFCQMASEHGLFPSSRCRSSLEQGSAKGPQNRPPQAAFQVVKEKAT